MKGGRFHNTLVRRVEALLQSFGSVVSLEHRVNGVRTGSADLCADIAGSRIVVEAELRPARLANDIRKALILKADLLVILAPTHHLARQMERKIQTLRPTLNAQHIAVICQPLPVVLEALKAFCQNRSSFRQIDQNRRRSS